MAQAYLLGQPRPAAEVPAPCESAMDSAYRPEERVVRPLVHGAAWPAEALRYE
jgi:hypothetical protein